MGFHGRCSWKGTRVSQAPAAPLLRGGFPVRADSQRPRGSVLVGIKGVISSGGGREAWAARELQSQGSGTVKIHLGATGGRREVVKLFTVICFCILLVRAVQELKTPLEDGDQHGGNSAGKRSSCTSAACCEPTWKARAESLPGPCSV